MPKLITIFLIATSLNTVASTHFVDSCTRIKEYIAEYRSKGLEYREFDLVNELCDQFFIEQAKQIKQLQTQYKQLAERVELLEHGGLRCSAVCVDRYSVDNSRNLSVTVSAKTKKLAVKALTKKCGQRKVAIRIKCRRLN